VLGWPASKGKHSSLRVILNPEGLSILSSALYM
jgi:hypothetical protein